MTTTQPRFAGTTHLQRELDAIKDNPKYTHKRRIRETHIAVGTYVNQMVAGVICDILDGFPLGRTEDSLETLVDRRLRGIAARPGERELGFNHASFQDRYDDMLQHLVIGGEVLQREIGGQVRLVLADQDADLDEADDVAGGDGR